MQSAGKSEVPLRHYEPLCRMLVREWEEGEGSGKRERGREGEGKEEEEGSAKKIVCVSAL